MKTRIYVQHNGNDVLVKDLENAVKETYKAHVSKLVKSKHWISTMFLINLQHTQQLQMKMVR